MKNKIVCSIALGLVISAGSASAADPISNAEILQRLEALEKGTQSSNWAGKMKIKGDFRYRFEDRESDEPGTSDKSRHRIRARVGVYGKVNDQVEFGTRIASGSTNATPISTNQDIDGYGSSKSIWLDLAYITLNCNTVEGLSATFGKMKQPWVTVSDLVYDTDLNPEGISAGYDFDLDGISVMTHAGHFILDENTGDDVRLTSGQLAVKIKIADGVSVTAGANIYDWTNEDMAVVGTGNSGAVDFTILEGFAQVNLSNTPVPVKIFGDYVKNVADDVSDDTAWMVGVGTKVGKLSIDYNFREIKIDSIYGSWADSDFHDGGTGGSGHKIKAKYPLLKNLSAGATYFITETEAGNDVNTLQLDLVAKF